MKPIWSVLLVIGVLIWMPTVACSPPEQEEITGTEGRCPAQMQDEDGRNMSLTDMKDHMSTKCNQFQEMLDVMEAMRQESDET